MGEGCSRAEEAFLEGVWQDVLLWSDIHKELARITRQMIAFLKSDWIL